MYAWLPTGLPSVAPATTKVMTLAEVALVSLAWSASFRITATGSLYSSSVSSRSSNWQADDVSTPFKSPRVYFEASLIAAQTSFGVPVLVNYGPYRSSSALAAVASSSVCR